MQAFMLYMSGSTIQVFSIGTLVMLLFSPFTNVSKISSSACNALARDIHRLILLDSIHALCASWKRPNEAGPVFPPEDYIRRLQLAHTRARPLEMQTSWPVASGNGRLAWFRDAVRGTSFILRFACSSQLTRPSY